MSESWPIRILAAIEKGERLSASSQHGAHFRNQVALARVVWELLLAAHDSLATEQWHDVVLEIEMEVARGQPLPILIAFAEQVEPLPERTEVPA